MDNTKPLSLPVLIAYVVAQEDEEWREHLDKQLAPWRRWGLLLTWSPADVPAGSDRQEETSAQLAKAAIVVLMLSPDYMASDQCDRWQQQVLARKDDVRILPVLVRPVNLSGSQIEHLALLPRDGQALSRALDKDTALLEITHEIHLAIDPERATQTSSAWESPEDTALAEELAWRADFLQAYRAKICSDTAMTRLQILGMNESLAVSDVYVKVHLHRQPRVSTSGDEKESRDPMALLQQRRSRLEHQVGSSVDPEIAVKSHKYCVFVGDPGAGKSTLLRRLTVQVAEQQISSLPALPIYLKLHELAQQERLDLFQAALTCVCDYNFPREQTERFLVELMEQGKVLLLLDALDETVVGATSEAAEASYQNVIKAIEQIMKRFGALRVVVTSRKADYFRRRQLLGFTALEVLDFLPREIEQFVRKWFQASGESHWQQAADTLIQDLRRKPRVATLAANPLLLTLIIITYKNHRRSLPDNRSQLYKQCVDMLLSAWDEERNITRHTTPIITLYDQKNLLPEIAWHFHQRGLWYFAEADLLPMIADFLANLGLAEQQAPEVLKEITGENGLLREQATGYYGFLHLTLQEYFAAVYSENQTEELLKHLGDAWWEEVILLSAGSTRDAGPLLQHLVPSSGQTEVPEDVFFSKLILAGRYLAARPSLSRPYHYLQQEIPERLFAIARTCPYTIVMQPLTEALAEIGRMYVDRDINSRLLELLTDEAVSTTLKGYILLAMGTYGSKTFSSPLLTMFKQQQFDWITDVTSIERLPFDLLESTLGNLCSGSELPMLFTMLDDEMMFNNAGVDVVALIGRIGGEMVISRFIQLLEIPTTDSQIRMAIPRMLGLYGSSATVAPTLIRWLADPDLANYCADGLLLLNDASVGSHLVAVLANAEISVLTRTYIAHVLTQIGDDKLVPPLRTLFDNNALEESVRAAIASTLVTIGDEEVRKELFELVISSRASDQIASEIVQAFSYIGDVAIVAGLQRLEYLPTISNTLKQEVVMALGVLGDQLAIAQLLEVLKAIHNEIWEEESRRVASIIESIGKYGSLDQIAALLRDTHYSSQVRIQLLDTIPELSVEQQKSLLPILMDIIAKRTTIESVRKGAVWVLGQIADDQKVLERLIDLAHRSSIIDEIYRSLWRISRRAGVRIVSYGPGTQLRVWKW